MRPHPQFTLGHPGKASSCPMVNVNPVVLAILSPFICVIPPAAFQSPPAPWPAPRKASRASCRRPGPCRRRPPPLPPTSTAALRTQATASRPRSTRSRLRPATSITLPSSWRAPSRTAIGAALRRNWSISCRKTCGPPGISATTTLTPPSFTAPASNPSTPAPSAFAPPAAACFFSLLQLLGEGLDPLGHLVGRDRAGRRPCARARRARGGGNPAPPGRSGP